MDSNGANEPSASDKAASITGRRLLNAQVQALYRYKWPGDELLGWKKTDGTNARSGRTPDLKDTHKEVISAMRCTIPVNFNPENQELLKDYKKLMNKRKALRRSIRDYK